MLLSSELLDTALMDLPVDENCRKKLTDTNKVMNDTQLNLHKTIQSQFGQSAKIISDVTERLTKLDETNKQVISFADQLQSLENIWQGNPCA